MTIHKELINTKNPSPLYCSIFFLNSFEKCWHQNVEIIYILNGSVQIQCGNTNTYNLEKDDIFLINMFDPHTLEGKNCEILSLQIDISKLDADLSNLYRNRFDCNSSIEKDKTRFTPLKKLLASIIKSNFNKDINISLLNKSYIYNLFYLLNTYFKVENSEKKASLNKNSDRIKDILIYINNNYMNKISLETLSHNFYLSAPYMSKIFKDFTELSFTEYLSEVRLSYAVKELNNPDYTIDYIAEKNGFSNTRSFVTAFKKKYLCNPSNYRKNLPDSLNVLDKKGTIDIVNYLNLHQNNSFNSLVSYLQDDNLTFNNKNQATKVKEIPTVDTKKKSSPLKHNFKNLICIGKAKSILGFETQKMLKEVQNKIGFKYVRFHGILDDEMMLYSEDKYGNIKLCFTYIDMVIDFLLSINLKPFLELSFMPRDLSITPERTMFFLPSIISLPKDISKWIYLIKNLLSHFIKRYGECEVESWPIFLWNEPDLINMFGFKNKDDFFIFYKETYKAVKEINSKIAFGSPPVFSDTIKTDNSWLDSFLKFCSLNNCTPDYLTMHFYPMKFTFESTLNISKEDHLKMQEYLIYSENENILKETLLNIKDKVKKYNFNLHDIHLIGWNSSISHNELLNDTVYKSAYLAKNILENYDLLPSFGYYQLSDFTEEVKMQNELFHGGQGLVTYNGLKKAPYYTLELLSKIGDELIESGNGYFITKHKDSLKIILYNYEHFSKLYASGQIFDMTFTKRYAPFVDEHILKIIIPLINLENENYKIKETIINKKYGSSFDKSLECGELDLKNKDEFEFLKYTSIPKIQTKVVSVIHNSLTINCELEPHEVRLIEINKESCIRIT